MTFIDFHPNAHPQVGYKIGIGWCVWLGFEMIAAGFEDQSKALTWVKNWRYIGDAKLHKVEQSPSLCGVDD